MKSKFEGQTMVFRKDYEGRAFYSTTISNKKADGTYEQGYIDIKFKKGTELANKTIIDVKNGWLTFYLKDKKPIWQIFCNEFEILEEGEKATAPEGFAALEDDDSVPF